MKGKGLTLQLDNTSGIVKSIKLDNGKEFRSNIIIQTKSRRMQ
jgi:hypothetical protein